MAKKTTSFESYPDGFKIRLHNKRVTIVEDGDGDLLLYFQFADQDPHKPACEHSVTRDKVRNTVLKLSAESMEHLMVGYAKWRNRQLLDEFAKGKKQV